MNPMNILKLKQLIDGFKENHPKVPLFLQAASGTIREGSIVEMKITTPEGQNIVTNIKVTDQDIKLIEELRDLNN